MGKDYDTLINRSLELGALEARLVPTNEIVFDDRSFLKCRFGCNRWGKYWTCPPNLELTPERVTTDIIPHQFRWSNSHPFASV